MTFLDFITNEIFLWIVLCIFSYLYGSVNNAVIISVLAKKDIRKQGSGNPGSMNMFRSLGFWYGLLTLTLDALKGVIPALLGWFVLGTQFSFVGSKIGLYVCSTIAILGHIFPIFYKFKGGKGVATTMGVCFVLNWWMTLISFVAGVFSILITKLGFLGSFIILGLPCIYESVMCFIGGEIFGGVVLIVLYALVIFMHRKNLVRFFQGKENKTYIFAKFFKKKNNPAQEQVAVSDADTCIKRSETNEKPEAEIVSEENKEEKAE
ncbi:MAG: glycerol-3-phosphate acyltransferase [Clostridia bacterium]|nr:glycerol-3-phosphate acyltransferase [Clostridia bacterium]